MHVAGQPSRPVALVTHMWIEARLGGRSTRGILPDCFRVVDGCPCPGHAAYGGGTISSCLPKGAEPAVSRGDCRFAIFLFATGLW